MKKLRSENTAIHLSVLALIWFAGVSIVHPAGNFPLNDDWSFATAVQRLLDGGQFRPSGWTSMSLITQTLWGALFVKVGGYSYEVLRSSTLVAGFAGIAGCYFLMREMQRSRKLALLAAAAFGLSPLYVGLSYSFMTDIPFCAVFIPAALFFVRCLKHNRSGDYALAIAFSLAAVLCRQLGLCLSMAFFVCSLGRRGFTFRTVLWAAFPLILSAGGLMLLNHWMNAHSATPALYQSQGDEMAKLIHEPLRLARIVTRNLFLIVMYLGLFLLPVLVLVIPHLRATLANPCARRLALTGAGLFTIAGLIFMLAVGRSMPLAGNILNSTGVGPLLLRDTFVLKRPDVAQLPVWILATLTVGSLVGAAILVTLTIAKLIPPAWNWRRPSRWRRFSEDQAVVAMLLIASAAYLSPMLVMINLFDRYFLPLILLPLACLLTIVHVAEGRSGGIRFRYGLSLGLIGFFAFISFSATHDYLAWNRTRWEVLNDLVEVQKIKPESIDGGFEFNGLYLYDPNYVGSPSKSFWWVKDDTYVISFGPLPGYVEIGRRVFARWLPAHDGFIYTLRKLSPPPKRD